MTMREEFEEWHIQHVCRKPNVDAMSGMWEDDKKAWAAWKAAYAAGQRAEREACALVCEGIADGSELVGNTQAGFGADECAVAIRNRKEQS